MKRSLVRNVVLALFVSACTGDDITSPDSSRVNRPLATPGSGWNAYGVDAVSGASIETDKDDYTPGEIVHLTLKGWKPGEDVRLTMTELPDTHGDVDTTITVDVDGEWSGHFYDVQVHDLGAVFTLTATGEESSSSATVTFTDAHTLTITSAAPTPAVGADFDVTVNVVLTGSDDWNATRIRLDRVGASNPVYNRCFNFEPDQVDGADGSKIFTVNASGTGWSSGESLTAGSYTLRVDGADDDDDNCDSGLFPGGNGITQSFSVQSVIPDLTINKVANSDPVCDTGDGDPDFCVTRPATYTLTITNNGQNATSGTVTVLDTLPASAGDLEDKITFASGSGSGWLCSVGTTVAAPPRHIVTCTTTDVIAGSGGTKILTLNVNPQADGGDWTNVVNRAWVSGGGDTTPAVDAEQVDVRQLPDFFIASVVITPQPVAPGGTASANVTVTVDDEDWRCMIGRVRNADGSSLAGFSDIETDFEPDATADGTHSRSFNFTAPGTPGTYGLRVRVYTDDDCDDDQEELLVLFQVAAAPADVATTTEVLAAPTPTVFGQLVTFTATVTPVSGPAATGTVNFYKFTVGQTCTALGGAVAVGTDGTAPFQYATSGLAVGSHTITACYVPDAGWTSSFDDVTHTVNRADASVTVTDSPTSSTFGQSVTFTAVLAAIAPGVGTPAGTVTFYEFTGGQTCTLPGAAVGSADASAPYEFTTSSLSVGNHTITACYGGNTNFNANSGTDTHSVSAILTTTELLAAPSPSVFGQLVTFTATVTPASGPAAAGTVNFYEFTGGQSCSSLGGAVAIGTDGTAPFQFSTSSLSVATHTISACYVANTGWADSNDDVAHTVDRANTTTTVTDNLDPTVFGQSVTFTAAVAVVAPGVGTPAGVVSFYEFTGVQTCTALGGAVALGSDNVAPFEFATTSLSVGAHTISGCYEGNTNFNPSGGSQAHQVDKANTTTTVTDNPDPTVFGQSVTFTGVVAPVAPGAGTPAGVVSFYEFTGVQTCTALGGAVALGSDNVAPFEFATTSLSVGAHTISGCYEGNTNFNPSGGSQAHQVDKANSSVTLTDNPTGGAFGTSVTFTAALAAVAPGAGTPTGTVTFYEFTGVQSCTAPGAAVALGSDNTVPYQHTTNTLPAGAHTITACYGGDGNFNGNSGSDTHTVDQVTTTAIASTTTIPQYSDEINLKVVVTPAEVVISTGTVPLVGNVRFYFQTPAFACPVSDPGVGGAGVVGSDDIVDADNGIADDTDYQVLNTAGNYTLTACFYSTNPNFMHVGDMEAVTVTTEDATVTPGSPYGNAFQSGAGGTPVNITLQFVVKETNAEPDANAGALPGDIDLANYSVSLSGVAGGGNITGACTPSANNPAASAYADTRTFSCVFSNVPVDAYEISGTVSGNYYDGTYFDALTVYDPNAGFVTGGGKFTFPGSADRVNFGLVFKPGVGNKPPRGNLLVMRHLANGDVCRAKSNLIDAPAIVGNSASWSGKGNYNCTRPDGTQYDGAGNQTITGWVQDNGQGSNATGPDKFWVRALGPNSTLLMTSPATTNAAPLTGGNIQVPQPGGSKP